jgi:hypothetical protein
MPERFAWVPDPGRGEWLRPLEKEPFGSLLSVVPRGYEAYARVFHPLERDRPRERGTWLGVDTSTHFQGVEDLEAALETEPASWAMAAASFGTTMHPTAQSARLVRREYGEAENAIAPDGWRYSPPPEGCLEAASLAVLASVLAHHTGSPDAGVAAVWDGWGGLVSSAGVAHFWVEVPEGPPASSTDHDAGPAAGAPLRRRLETAGRRARARLRGLMDARPDWARSPPKPGSGLLERDIAAGPRFDLHADTGRSYVLFEAGADDFAEASWPRRAPWVDDARGAQSPSIIWPDDHAWVLATEIDFDSTLVAGSAALIRELVQAPGLEVLPIRPGDDLTWEGDALNGPD